MQDQMSALDVAYIIKDLKQLIGARVQNVYHPDGLYLQVHKSGVGKFLIRVEKSMIWLTDVKPSMPQKMSGICTLLRKYIKGKKITQLDQINGERIIRIQFETIKDKFVVYLELFSNGNIIICDKDEQIKKAKEERAWKHRIIERGQIYKLPPSKKSILELTEKDFGFTLQQNTGWHLSTLGFGMFFAIELCARAGIDPVKVQLSPADATKLYKEYKKILEDTSGPRVYSDGNIVPFKLKLKKENGLVFETYSKAIDSVHKAEAPKASAKAEQLYTKEQQRIQKLVSMQSQSALGQEHKAAENHRRGEIIYERYQEFDKMLKELNELSKTHSLQEIAKKLKGHKLIKELDPKTGNLVLEVDE